MAWLRRHPPLVITLDGEVMDRVMAFNRSEGWLERCSFPPHGKGIMRDGETNDILIHIRKGVVEAHFADA